MITSQYKGVVSCLGADGVLNRYLEDAVQEFFVAATGLDGVLISPDTQYRKVVSTGGTYGFYHLGTPQNVNVIDKRQEDEDTVITYCGTLDVYFVLYGERAMELALLVRDALSINQTAHILSEAGLGVIDAQVVSLTEEADAGHYIERSDVTINCNYTYRRRWAIKSLKSANPIINM